MKYPTYFLKDNLSRLSCHSVAPLFHLNWFQFHHRAAETTFSCLNWQELSWSWQCVYRARAAETLLLARWLGATTHFPSLHTLCWPHWKIQRPLQCTPSLFSRLFSEYWDRLGTDAYRVSGLHWEELESSRLNFSKPQVTSSHKAEI